MLINAALSHHMVSSIIIVIGVSIMAIVVGNKVSKLDPLGKTPIWLVPFISVVEIVNNFTKDNIGRRYRTYAPYILTLGLYLFIANMSSMFGLTAPTSYLVVNAALAIISFFIIQISGIISLGIKEYLKSFLGPVWYLSPLLLPINIIGELALPVSLSLRLMGNIISGAVLSKLLLGQFGFLATPVLPFFNLIFDVAFGSIQAVVFVLLTVIFTSMKISDEEKITQ